MLPPTWYLTAHFACLLADDSMCQHDQLKATGVSLDSLSTYQGYKRDRPIPTGSHCEQDPDSGSYWCGIEGAQCDDDDACDCGTCSESGTCSGGYGTVVPHNSECSGYLWCTPLFSTTTVPGGCGGDNAFCGDWDQHDLSTCATDEERWSRFDRNCHSGKSSRLPRSHCSV